MKKPQTTRTLNPLPLEALEPHRFEDLVRGLAYDFRRWAALEARGASGGDDGIDILGTEMTEQDEVTDEGEATAVATSRQWIFQCKREKSLGPKDVKKAVAESLGTRAAPHGFVLAAACNVSAAARDTFRSEMVQHGVKEFHLWARGELEDMLFQAKNDRILFGFFGLSLHANRQSSSAALRAAILLKKRLRADLEQQEQGGRDRRLVLIRDPLDDRYPHECDDARWMLCEYFDTDDLRGMRVIAREHLSWVKEREGKWDALFDFDASLPEKWQCLMNGDDRRFVPGAGPAESEYVREMRRFWRDYVPGNESAVLKVVRRVPSDRVVAFDPLGDRHHPVPQLFVTWHPAHGPFDEGKWGGFHAATAHGKLFETRPTTETRTAWFPVPMPQRSYPPPAGLEPDVSPAHLTDPTAAELKAVLATATGEEPPVRLAATEGPASTAERDTFVKWRHELVTPIFVAIRDTLRAAGHEAWVVASSTSADGHGSGWSEAVELNVRLNWRPYATNPGYRLDGHVSFCVDEDSFRCRIEPSKETDASMDRSLKRSAASSPTRPTVADYDRARIEREAIRMLSGLAATGRA